MSDVAPEPIDDTPADDAPLKRRSPLAVAQARIEELEAEVADLRSRVPEEDHEPQYVVTRDFKHMVRHNLLAFRKDEVLDPRLGEELRSQGAPVVLR